MDSNYYLELQPEPDFGHVNTVSETADKPPVSDPSITYEKVYEIPNVYAEIPNADYEALQSNEGTIDLPMSTQPRSPASNTRPALPGEPQQHLCCKKSARFWCLLTVALSTITAMLLAVFLTGI